MSPAERSGIVYRMSWFEAPARPTETWKEHIIASDIEAVRHFVGAADLDNDGDTDVVSSEMHQGRDPDDISVYWKVDQGKRWIDDTISREGSHSMRLADVDQDGDIDFFGANWSGKHQQLEPWTNNSCPSLGPWRRWVIDEKRPGRAVFVESADPDGDGLFDVAAGDWWYRNPARLERSWDRKAFGNTFDQMAAIVDVDGDGALDVIGTAGESELKASTFMLARNDGKGSFEIVGPIAEAHGDFLLGTAGLPAADPTPFAIALPWHAPDRGIELLQPDSEASGSWRRKQISNVSQDEALSAGDIDQDGDLELLLGTKWLRNDGEAWSTVKLAADQQQQRQKPPRRH